MQVIFLKKNYKMKNIKRIQKNIVSAMCKCQKKFILHFYKNCSKFPILRAILRNVILNLHFQPQRCTYFKSFFTNHHFTSNLYTEIFQIIQAYWYNFMSVIPILVATHKYFLTLITTKLNTLTLFQCIHQFQWKIKFQSQQVALINLTSRRNQLASFWMTWRFMY